MSELKDQDPDYGPSITNTEKQQRLYEENARISTARKITAIIEKEFSHEIASKEKEIFEIQNRLQRALKTLHLLRYVIVTDFYNKKQCKLQTESRQTQPHPAIKSLIGKSPKTHFPATVTNCEKSVAAGSEASLDYQTTPDACAKPCFSSGEGTLRKTESLSLDQSRQDDPSGLETSGDRSFQGKDLPAEFSYSELYGNCSKPNSLERQLEQKCFYNLDLEENNTTVNGLQVEPMEKGRDCNKFNRNNSTDFEGFSEKNSKHNKVPDSNDKSGNGKAGHLVERADTNFLNFDALSSNSFENLSGSSFDNRTEKHSSYRNNVAELKEGRKEGIQRRLATSSNFGDNLIDRCSNEIAINETNGSKDAPKKIPRYIPPKSTSPSCSPSRLRQKVRKRLIIGNISKWIPPDYREDNSTHKWTIYVQGNRENRNIDYISKVRFFLHPSYRPNDVIEVSNYPFCISRRGWGEFPIRIQLHFKNSLNKPVDVIHYLKLDKSYTGLQTLGSETVVDVWIYEENEKAKRKAVSIEKDSEEGSEKGIDAGTRCKRQRIGESLMREPKVNEDSKVGNEGIKSPHGNDQRLKVPEGEESAEGRPRGAGVGFQLPCKANCTEEEAGTVKKRDEKQEEDKSFQNPEARETGGESNGKPSTSDFPESGTDRAAVEHSSEGSREEGDSMKDRYSMLEECTEELFLEGDRVSPGQREPEGRPISSNNFAGSMPVKETANSLERIRSVISLDHDYLGSVFSKTEKQLEKFLEIEKASLQSTVKDRMIKLDSNLQPLRISIPSPFESSSKRVLVLQNDKTIPVEITSRPKNKLAGRSLLKRNSSTSVNETSNGQATNGQEDRKNSAILQMNAKAVIFDVNSSVPTLKIANVLTRDSIETKNSRAEDKEERVAGIVEFDKFDTLDSNDRLDILAPESEKREPRSTVRQEESRQTGKPRFQPWLKGQVGPKREESCYKPESTGPTVEDGQSVSVKPKLTIGKDKHKLQNKREFYWETLARLESIELFEIPSFLRFVIARLPLVTEHATDPEYRKLHPYSCTSETEYFRFSVAKQRAMEWQRAKVARELLKKRMAENGEELWSIKEIVVWARHHGYTPVDRHTPVQESSKSNHSCFTSITEPQQFIKWKESNPTNSTDPGDVDSSVNIVDIESDRERDESNERRLEVLGMEKKLEPLYEFVSTTSRQIGLKLQPEEIVPNIAYCAAARLIMRAVECLVDDLLRSSLAKAWERREYSGCPNVIRLDDVRHAIRHRDEFSLFTNSGLGSIYQPPKD